MKIYSKFKDYYDSAISFGVDSSSTYERIIYTREIIETRGNTVEPKYPNILHLYGREKKACIIGFCGKLYPCVVLDDMVVYEKPYDNYDSWNRQLYDDFWNNTQSLIKHAETLFLEAPVFIYTHTAKGKQITFNPCLKDLEFYKIVDATTAFQEISMFLGTHISNKEVKSEPLSESQALQKHGMDKWSFKKKTK